MNVTYTVNGETLTDEGSGITFSVDSDIMEAQRQDATTGISVDDLDPFNPMAYNGQTNTSPWESSVWDGGKFAGGFGPTQLQDMDYWTLRARSSQLFNENLYARGLIRRLITNEINTGLMPEACPDNEILGLDEDAINDWAELVETRYALWGKDSRLVDWRQFNNMGALQRIARMEALVGGDVLVVLHQNQRTKLPVVELIAGHKVRTPMMDGGQKLTPGNEIRHGVEIDKRGRVVAHHVTQSDGTSKRVAAFGARTGRKISWLIYGTDKRMDDLRGQPLLSLVLQSLKEIDRYRDSAQRKATLNSIIAMYIKKTEDKMSTLPLQGGAKRVDQAQVNDAAGPRTRTSASYVPGLIMEELQTGEEPVAFGNEGIDINFARFEEAIIQAVAWANEMPPEILRLAFSNNYSASQAAINEFKIYLNKVWGEFGATFCQPIYNEWLLSEVLLQSIQAEGFLQAWRNLSRYDVYGAWVNADWYGSIKPSTDMLKQAKGSELLILHAWTTNAREARALTGTKFSKNAKRVKRENELLVEMARPIAEFKVEFGEEIANAALGESAKDESFNAMADEIEGAVLEIVEAGA